MTNRVFYGVVRSELHLTFRPNFDELAGSLTALGADHVLTYDSLNDKSIKDQVKSWTGGKVLA